MTGSADEGDAPEHHNTAVVLGTGLLPGGGDGETVTDEDDETVDLLPGIDLTIDKDDGISRISPGQQTTYTLTISNVGQADATNVAVTDELPPNTTFVEASDDGTHADGVVTWPTFDLPSGSTTTRTVTVRVNDDVVADEEIINVATVTDDGTHGQDPTPENNTDDDVNIDDPAAAQDDGLSAKRTRTTTAPAAVGEGPCPAPEPPSPGSSSLRPSSSPPAPPSTSPAAAARHAPACTSELTAAQPGSRPWVTSAASPRRRGDPPRPAPAAAARAAARHAPATDPTPPRPPPPTTVHPARRGPPSTSTPWPGARGGCSQAGPTSGPLDRRKGRTDPLRSLRSLR